MANQPGQPQQDNQGQRKIQIKMSDDVLKGSYANAMQVAHTQEEFIMDFMNLSPQQGVGIVNSRVIISPGHLKRLIAALQTNLKQYEDHFGQVKAAESPNEIGFKSE